MGQIGYVIVQAGGKGSRLKYLTANKPKALVPVDNLPMIFHLFKKFPDKNFIVIGDYKCDVLERYLKAFATVNYQIVKAAGKSGTCAGMREALSLIPDDKQFLLIWCDLILPDEYELPKESGSFVGLSRDFPCRWKYENGQFMEERSSSCGVAGHFIFESKAIINDVPEEGEFVRYLSTKHISFKEQSLWKTHEYGLLEEWDKLPKRRTRPFNALEIKGEIVTKLPLDQMGIDLAKNEADWYSKAMELGFSSIPKIYSFSPLTMELIHGKCLYETGEYDIDLKRSILRQTIVKLKELHSLASHPFDAESYFDAYYGKTMKRLEKVEDLVPFAKNEAIIVNGKRCRNPLFHKEWMLGAIKRYTPEKFAFIHGDCTFSNTMVKGSGEPVLLDPRGYFGSTKFYGDPAYDWVKLYYSVVGNYDQFNLKRFRLLINEDSVNLEISSNGYEVMESIFFELLSGEISRPQMALLHSIVWLSLTTYAWEDYDSICGAFYNGVRYFEEAMELNGD